jgi:uncharacterized membrane protein (UPF0136 family)
VVSAIGGILIFRSTNWGPWAFSDSAAYISAARNIQSNLGPVIINASGSITAVTEFPPGFPFILSKITPNQGNFIQSARYLNVLCFALTIFLAGMISQNFLKNRFLGVAVSASIALSPVMLETFSGFMSEPLFIAFLLFSIFCMINFLQTGHITFFLLIIFAASLLPMIRYAGIAFVVCIGLILIAYHNIRLLKLEKLIPIFFIAALSPVLGWFVYQYQVFNKFGGKSFSFNFALIRKLTVSILEELKLLINWIPYSGKYSVEPIKYFFIGITLILFIFAAIRTMISFFKKNSENSTAIISLQIYAFLIFAYLLFIGFTHSITVPQIDIIDRMLAPIYPLLILFIFTSLDGYISTNSFSLTTYFLFFFLLLSLRYNFLLSMSQIDMLYEDGLGYTAKEIVQSRFIKELGDIPDGVRMISNDAAFVLFHTNRFPLPVIQFHNRPYGSGNAYGEESFRERPAALIIIYPEFRNYYGEGSSELLINLTRGLAIAYQDEIGGIYYPPN